MLRRLLLLLLIAALGVGGWAMWMASASSDAPRPPLGLPDLRPPRAEKDAPPIRRARCPRDLGNCAEATGRVVAVESVDPDGDGDAHYVLVGGDVTAPGVSIIDVSKDLRPKRLPSFGDQVSAAGPVFTGSHGQRQIQAVVVHYRRR